MVVEMVSGCSLEIRGSMNVDRFLLYKGQFDVSDISFLNLNLFVGRLCVVCVVISIFDIRISYI